MTMPRRVRWLCIGSLLCVLASAAPVTADYHDTFIDAIRMFRGQRWKEAASLFQRARAQRPRETGRIQISGNDTEPYSPSYFLGESLYRLGDCPAAVDAWNQAERSPASLSVRMLSRLARARSLCQRGGTLTVAAPPAADSRATAPAPGARAGSPPAGDTRLFRVTGDFPGPRRIKYVPAVYPAAARAAGVRGSVEIEATIDARGHVSDARVIRSVPMLDQAAIDAVGQWEFAPTVVNGVAVPVVMTVTIFFSGQ